jgi:DNA polymerase-3 subunit beta
MEFTIKKNIILDGIKNTLGVVSNKTTLPILNNVLVVATDKIKIIATDREISLITLHEATVSVCGETTISARKLYELLREIESEYVEFKLIGNQMTITGGKAVFKIPTISTEDYPSIKEDSEGFFKISGKKLDDMISKTVFAISTDEMRPQLSGAYFKCAEGMAEMVSTDGHRLAISNKEIDSISTPGIIIPKKGLIEISKFAEVDNIEMAISDRCIVRSGDSTLIVSLIDSEFPDYNRIIPQDKDGVAINRDEMISSLKRINVVSSERFSSVKIEIAENKITFSSSNPDIGEAKDEIDIEYNGEPLVAGFNIRYLIEAFSSASEPVSFSINGTGPSVVKSEGYKCIVMPVNL